jgi:dienelactone hydrolase
MQRILGTLSGRRHVGFLAACVCARLLSAAVPALCQVDKTHDLPSPGQVADVTCASDAAESYALYLPSAYTPARRWPIIYFFDPGGHGRRPIELYKDVAEKYGFIFAGSNTSRNFSSDQSKSVNLIWQDTHMRLALDEHRMYASGFSGGARVAGMMGLSCPDCGIAGIIANGAAYPSNRSAAKDNLLYFFAVGDQDFNWPEIITARREREEKGLPYRARVFPGRHQWAPADVMEDAVQWLVLKAMQSGALASDAAFIDRIFQQTQSDAADAEKKKDAIAQLAAYRSLVADFVGLKDVKDPTAKLAALKPSAELKAALKGEQEQIAEQYSLEREISPKVHAYVEGTAQDLDALRISVVQAMAGLKDQAARAKPEAKRLIFRRAFDGLWVEGIETGQQELQARHFEKAENCFSLLKQVSDDPWPVLLLADTHAAEGNKKQAIKDLQEAVKRGLKDPETIASDSQLQVLKTDPEFQKLLAGMKGN